MSEDRNLGALEALLLDAVGSPAGGARFRRWEEEPTRELLESLGEGAEDFLALRAFKLATRRCEHNPNGPACPACAASTSSKTWANR